MDRAKAVRVKGNKGDYHIRFKSSASFLSPASQHADRQIPVKPRAHVKEAQQQQPGSRELRRAEHGVACIEDVRE